MTELQSRWEQLRSRLPAGVNLLAVSKRQPAAAVRELASCGQCDFGESRVQEALPKQQELSDVAGLRWHFIGRLQANKVRPVVKAFDWIHSIDSLSLAERVSRIAWRRTGVLRCCSRSNFGPIRTRRAGTPLR